jgi:hypothetical protein
MLYQVVKSSRNTWTSAFLNLNAARTTALIEFAIELTYSCRMATYSIAIPARGSNFKLMPSKAKPKSNRNIEIQNIYKQK